MEECFNFKVLYISTIFVHTVALLWCKLLLKEFMSLLESEDVIFPLRLLCILNLGESHSLFLRDRGDLDRPTLNILRNDLWIIGQFVEEGQLFIDERSSWLVIGGGNSTLLIILYTPYQFSRKIPSNFLDRYWEDLPPVSWVVLLEFFDLENIFLNTSMQEQCFFYVFFYS